MAGPGPICLRCFDDKWRLSGRHWCDSCEAFDRTECVCRDSRGAHAENAGPCERCDCGTFVARELDDAEVLGPIEYFRLARPSTLKGRAVPRRGHGASEGGPIL